MKGKIYVVKNKIDNKFYVGSTTQLLCNRMSGHRQRAKDVKRTSKLYSLMREYGIDKFYIELLEDVEGSSVQELQLKEKEYILKFSGENQLNQQVVKRTPKEYYDTHRAKRLENARNHYLRNYAERLEYAKNYAEKHKEKIKAYNREREECECGSVYTKINRNQHLRTEKHRELLKSKSLYGCCKKDIL